MIGLFQRDLLNSNDRGEEFSTGNLNLKAKPEKRPNILQNPFCSSFAGDGSSMSSDWLLLYSALVELIQYDLVQCLMQT